MMAAKITSMLVFVLALGACSTVKSGEASEPVVDSPKEATTDPEPRAVTAPKPAEASSPGQARSSISGCLTEAEGMPAKGAATRSAAAPQTGLDVTAHSWGILVNHSLHHPCCLAGKVETTVEKSHVTVREVLSGNVCRCMCSSNLVTRIPVLPGEYTVDVVVETNGKVAESLAATATVRTISLKPTPKP